MLPGSQTAAAEDEAGAELLELGCPLPAGGDAQLEAVADADPDEGAPVEGEAPLGAAGVEGAVGIQREDRRVPLLVPVVARLGGGVDAEGARADPAHGRAAVHEALRAEVAAVAEGEEALVVLVGERGEAGADSELADRSRVKSELRSCSSRQPRVVLNAQPDQPAAFAIGVDRSCAAVDGQVEPAALE